MRKFTQKQILEIIGTLHEGLEFAALNAGSENSKLMLDNCGICIEAIEKSLVKSLSDKGYAGYSDIIRNIRTLIQKFKDNISSDEIKGDLDKNTQLLTERTENESEIEYEIVFMPYNASMWDSLESIWKAAENDERCNAHVVPIPYYDRKPDGSLGGFHYEGGKLPDYVPVENYESFDLAVSRPDVIYVHNPYEQYNRVTTIDPKFYAPRLKKYTDLLVYVPYFIASSYYNAESAVNFLYPPIMNYADYIIYQSDVQLKMLIQAGYSPEKALVLGNPKFDYIINNKNICKKNSETKTFFIATTLGRMLRFNNPAEWCELLLKPLFDAVLKKENTKIIWRPHPLTYHTITSMRPEMKLYYNNMLKEYSEKADFVIDVSSDAINSIAESDAMIFEGGSLGYSYISTQKPIIGLFSTKNETENIAYTVTDPSGIYFCDDIADQLGLEGVGDEYSEISIERKLKAVEFFVSEVLNGRDVNRIERMNRFNRSVKNSDGTSGEKIHKKIMEIEGNR